MSEKRDRHILSFQDKNWAIRRQLERVAGPFANRSEVLRQAVKIGLRELEQGAQRNEQRTDTA
jgi:Arc/MetJ-type ribon-helix-helix transcriptional regulator